MARRGLEDRIEAWPEQWREARTRYVDAKALVAKLELQLERAKERAAAREEAAEDDGDGGYMDAGTPAIIETDRRLMELEFKVQRATMAVERAKAEADVMTRNAALAAGQKMTEAGVEARVKSDPAYIASQERLLEAKQQHALAKFEREQQWRTEREQSRASAYDVQEEEPETEEMLRLRGEVDDAYRQLEKARTDLGYQTKIGQALQMLTEVMKADSVVAAAVPLHAR